MVWLYAGLASSLPEAVRYRLDADEPVCSPMAALEMQYLQETGKIADSPVQILSSLQREIGLRVCTAPYAEVVGQAYAETWTRDPFDRLIVAQARLTNSALASKDRRIRQHYQQSIWD
jgi:PIN domain nuclease of toxin-antitoxin system